MRNASAAIVVSAALLTACARSIALTPLPGAPVAAAMLPPITLAPGYRQLVFNWEYEDTDISARGEGAARIAPPDSARVDLFLGGGFGAAAALIGDSLRTPGIDLARRYLPPAAMLWAGFGRLALPTLPDTVVTQQGDVLRADIGRPAAWRVTMRNGELLRLDHVDGGRIIEFVTRDSTGSLEYQVPAARRRLTLKVTQTRHVQGFDPSIWNF